MTREKKAKIFTEKEEGTGEKKKVPWKKEKKIEKINSYLKGGETDQDNKKPTNMEYKYYIFGKADRCFNQIV